MPTISVSYDAVPQSDFKSQYSRVFEAAECSTQLELATLLGVRQSSISDAKRRQFVPAGWLVKLLEKKQINPHWIRTGFGSKMLEARDADGAIIPFITVTERRPMEDCTTEELFAEIMRRATKAMGASQ